MALNWYLTLRNLSKTDEQAKVLYEALQKAETDEEKESAKAVAQEYVATVFSGNKEEDKSGDSDNTETEIPVSETVKDEEPTIPDTVLADNDSTDNTLPDTDDLGKDEEPKKEPDLTDMSAPAFTPRLAKCGITREEELFLNGVLVRKMTREEKILMRRSIYQKKTQRNAQIQAEFRAKRLEQKIKELNDPEKQKFHQERKLVGAVVKALEQHKNMVWMFSQIDGLTPEVLRELLKKPENESAIKTQKSDFVENFYKKYGE